MISITWKKSNLLTNWVTFKRDYLSPQETLTLMIQEFASKLIGLTVIRIVSMGCWNTVLFYVPTANNSKWMVPFHHVGVSTPIKAHLHGEICLFKLLQETVWTDMSHQCNFVSMVKHFVETFIQNTDFLKFMT